MEGRCIRVVLFCCFMVIATATEASIPFRYGRSLIERSNDTKARNDSLTSDRTIRIDPLDDFHKYRGGYNITNKNYWSSVVFTGIYGYAIGILWLLGGVIYGIFLLIENCCSKKNNKEVVINKLPCKRKCYLWPSLIAILLTFVALIAVGAVIVGSLRFHSRANTVKRIVSDTADDAVETIHNVTSAVGDIEANTKRYNVTILETSTQLNSTLGNLEVEAGKIRDKAYDSVKIIGKGLDALEKTTIVIVALTAFLVITLLCLRFLKVGKPFQVFLTICWFLVFLLWMFFGLYFFLDRFAGDTCVALEDYSQKPGNSSLSSILPCNDQDYANSAIKNTKATISSLINQVNANISATPTLTSVTKLGLICNPFSKPPEYSYSPDLCSKNTTKIGDIPSVLEKFACTGSGCGNGKFIPASDYAAISAFTTSIQQLIDALPGAENLASCRLVEDAFSEILLHQCRPLKRGAKLTWIAMTWLATLATLLVVLWVTIHRHDSKSHSSSIESVGPHFEWKDRQEDDST